MKRNARARIGASSNDWSTEGTDDRTSWLF